MKRFVYAAGCVAVMAFAPALAFADVVIVPEVDTWVQTQPDRDMGTVQGEVVVGQPLPPTVKLMAVPKHKEYGFVVVNKKRVLVDSGTRKIIKVY